MTKEKTIIVRVTADEKKRLEKRAKERNITVSELVRIKALGKRKVYRERLSS